MAGASPKFHSRIVLEWVIELILILKVTVNKSVSVVSLGLKKVICAVASGDMGLLQFVRVNVARSKRSIDLFIETKQPDNQ